LAGRKTSASASIDGGKRSRDNLFLTKIFLPLNLGKILFSDKGTEIIGRADEILLFFDDNSFRRNQCL